MTDINTSTPLKVTIHPLPQNNGASTSGAPFWSSETPNFKDVLDALNPLQHIPIVSDIYQSLTGDVPSTGAKLAGGALFGGVIGLAGSIFDSIIQAQTGTNISGNLLAAIEGKPVPALGNDPNDTAASSGFLTATQRTNYNAYVQASLLT